MIALPQSLKALHDALLPALQGFFESRAQDLDILTAPAPALVIAPHPDDETLGCGAAIARLRAAGRRVVILIVTDGAASGHSAIVTPTELAVRRRREALEAAFALGVPAEDVMFLEFPDGAAATHGKAIEMALGEKIAALAPGQIFAPYGIDGNPDHRAVAAAIERLCHAGRVPCPVYEYPIWFWTAAALGHLFRWCRMQHLGRVAAGAFLDAKKAAMQAHRSQYEAPTGEPGWFLFTPRTLARFFRPYELFFARPGA
ncbi:MAG TPA: PIG-L deacetylase family protein [Alphaproteobacteria bacterium]|nr:PIG-L deacetylase family protein [Alphaproteobacteria bacterium]